MLVRWGLAHHMAPSFSTIRQLSAHGISPRHVLSGQFAQDFNQAFTVSIAGKRKTGGAIMNWKHWISLLGVVAASTAMAGPIGTAPRSAADKYRTHAERDGVAIGAELLSSSQTRNIFTYDVSHSCLVVEVAFYPQKDKPLHISLDDFT